MLVVDPAVLVGSVAPVAGSAAEPSLVVVGVRDGRGVAALRVDLAVAVGVVDRLAGSVAGEGVSGAAAVIVDAYAKPSCGVCARRFAVLCAELAAALARHGLGWAGAFVVDLVVEGGRWFSVADAGVAGVLGGSESSESAEAALSSALQRPRFRTRSEVRSPSVSVDPRRVAVLDGLLSAQSRGGAESVPVAVRSVVEVVQRVEEWDVLTDEQMAAAGVELTDRQVRAALMCLADSAELAGSAHFLWRDLARVLPSPYRTGALMLLAFTAFRRGEGNLACVAAHAVLADRPEDRLAGLVARAHAAGWTPEAVRAVLDGAEAEMTTW